MEILLTILKVIGIILAVILGLLLFIILAVLFVGISYKLEGGYGSDIKVKARVAWLWRLICIKVAYIEKNLDYSVKIFGIPFITKTRLERKKAKKEAKNRQNEDNISEDDVTDAISDNVDNVRFTNKETGKSNMNSPNSQEADNNSDETATDKKSIAETVTEKTDAVKNKVTGIFNKVKTTKDKAASIANNRDYRAFFKKTWGLVVGVLKKILPRKHYFYVHYGSSDPASTGQICGYVAMAQAVIPLKICFVPEFDEEITEVKGYIYGKIRLISIVIPALKIIFDRRFKKLRKQIQNK